jgi:hypothetical protein
MGASRPWPTRPERVDWSFDPLRVLKFKGDGVAAENCED